jgi:uncharacterized membrane protein (DUF485 family)
MLHEPGAIIKADPASAKKAKLGLILFFCYLIIYAGFVVIGLTNPELMGSHALGSLNIAIIYGFGLIFLAIVMGFIYNLVCTAMENKVNKTNNK